MGLSIKYVYYWTNFLTPFYLWELHSSPMIVEFNTEVVLGIIYVGAFVSLFAYVLWNKAIHNIGASKAGMIYYTILFLVEHLLIYF